MNLWHSIRNRNFKEWAFLFLIDFIFLFFVAANFCIHAVCIF
jgi:hypothetical protein